MPDAVAASSPEESLPAVRAWRSPASWLLLSTVLALGLSVDLATKWWTFENVAAIPVRIDRARILEDPFYDPVPHHQPHRVMPWNLLHLRLVINKGAVFGLGQDKREFFIVFTVVAVAAAIVFFARTSASFWLAHAALGLILAGGLGNLFDRWQFAAVRDFLHMLPGWQLPFGLSWPGGSGDIFPWVFNLADVMLLSGMALLLLHINRVETRKERTRKSTEAALEEAVIEEHLASGEKIETPDPPSPDDESPAPSPQAPSMVVRTSATGNTSS
jgi:signal peptidase II